MLLRRSLAVFLVLCLPVVISAEESDLEPVPITLQRISEKVINLRVGDAADFGHIICNNVLAVSTQKGIIIIDTGYYPHSAFHMRELIQKEFGRQDIAYVINTHWHWDHINGNQAFKDAVIIAHENIVPAMKQLEKGLQYFINQRKERVQDWMNTLNDAPPGSDLELTARGWSYAHQRFIDEFEQGFKIIYPAVTFKERLSLDMGDLKLELIHFPGFHSDNDIIIHIPEEKILASGDLFYHSSLPAVNHASVTNILVWLNIIGPLIADTNSVKDIIPGHGELLSYREIKDEWNYISSIYKSVTEARKRGMSFEKTAAELDYETHFSHLNFFAADLRNVYNHKMNLESIWYNNKKPAVTALKMLLQENNIDSALQEFNQRYRNNEDFYINKDEFTDTGYNYFLFGKYTEAAVVLSLTADLFPNDADVRELLGEVHFKAGNMSKAVINYKKSLELNPQNTDIKKKLEKLSN